MRYLKILPFIFCSSYIFAQVETEKIYLSKDSLTEILLLSDSKISYLKYHRSSPYTLKDTRIRRMCAPSFVIDEKGFGNYTIENDTLKAEFSSKNEAIAMIDVKKIKTSKANIHISINTKYFYSGHKNNDIWIEVTAGESTYNNLMEDEIEFEISEDRLPLNLTIKNPIFGNSNEVEILDNNDYEITVFINEHNLYRTKIKNIKVPISELVIFKK